MIRTTVVHKDSYCFTLIPVLAICFLTFKTSIGLVQKAAVQLDTPAKNNEVLKDTGAGGGLFTVGADEVGED